MTSSILMPIGQVLAETRKATSFFTHRFSRSVLFMLCARGYKALTYSPRALISASVSFGPKAGMPLGRPLVMLSTTSA